MTAKTFKTTAKKTTSKKVEEDIHGMLRDLQDEIDALKKFLKAKEPEIERLRKAQKKLERFRAIRNNLGNRAIRMLDGR